MLLQFEVLQYMQTHYRLRVQQISPPAPRLAGGTHGNNEVGLNSDDVQQGEVMNSSMKSHLSSWCPLSSVRKWQTPEGGGILQGPQLHNELIGIQEKLLPTR